MSFWTVVPVVVRKSKRISAEEKELYYELMDRRNAGGYSTDTNAELAKALGVSEKTITTRLSNLKAKNFVSITSNVHKRQRMVFLKQPGDPHDEPMPSEEALKEKSESLQNTWKKAIVFGDVEPQILIQRFRESSYLENIQDNSSQFILSAEQIKFLARFLSYPGKKMDCQLASYEKVDLTKLIDAIEKSQFLQDNANLSLKWCLTHADEIIAGKYKASCNEKENIRFEQRNYSSGELNSSFSNIDEIDI